MRYKDVSQYYNLCGVARDRTCNEALEVIAEGHPLNGHDGFLC